MDSKVTLFHLRTKEQIFNDEGGLIAQNDFPDADSAIYLPSSKVKLIIDGGIVSSVGSYTLERCRNRNYKGQRSVRLEGDNEDDVFNGGSYILNDPAGSMVQSFGGTAAIWAGHLPLRPSTKTAIR